jgi:hypothetical protein
MCACKETDVRESPNDSTSAGGERQCSRGEKCYATFDENPVSSLPERTVLSGRDYADVATRNVPHDERCYKLSFAVR